MHKVVSGDDGWVTNVEALAFLKERLQKREEALKRYAEKKRKDDEEMRKGEEEEDGKKKKKKKKKNEKIEAIEKEIQSAEDAMNSKLEVADEIMDKALRYLESTPAKTQNVESAAECLRFLNRGKDSKGRDLRLTPEERLMIINHAPEAPVVIHSIIEKFESRYSDSEDYVIEDIMNSSKKYLRQAPSS
uniref:DNA-directed RNA polymerase III subunit RPC9 n=1 Tax=Aureoumbra lagunensis TaxID=44058 RepID=A0A7S3NJA9_9STRA|eukprot:CAMPEP_0197311304 /NCGR_PEP_ID=MMETSP0891-20130614/9793_1 /TAXON_ID=44058 ORGANISM="Aureoumbra lagunensis, Strain CCMP1510" /NCGR_SAMPLE_ID=MMETSP0891 /ASSEMBLY_ACC=CAM_ASM_000534 /LENGTH=188 /DNA_ID=CAMNT_0042797359 /DNA_START=42 /DNA_END=608 /DNA_ORIENTATION=+